jgi:hypothetical protein
MIGPTLPDWLNEFIPAVKVNSFRDVDVTITGFGQYENGCAFAKFHYPSDPTNINVWTAPLHVFEF